MVETSSDTRNLLHPPPALPKCSPSGLAPPVKEALDRIGAKCITISNNLPLASTKLVPLLHITNNDLEKVTENLFRPKIGSFPMQVTKYLAENFNLQTITYQKTPGVLDTNNNRLPQDYHLAVMLQGISEPQGLPIETVEEEFHSLLECILHFIFFRVPIKILFICFMGTI